jgi:hypothetical protein
MTPEQEYDLFLKKCKKEKIEPRPELFTTFQEKVRLRSLQLEAWQKTDEFKAFEKERIRRQQRTVKQTIDEDSAIISPIDDKQYTTVRSWEEHKKANDVIEVGNEISKKRSKQKHLQTLDKFSTVNITN